METKASVYIETTVIGHLVGRMRSDEIAAARQLITRDWWRNESANYHLFVSRLVADECGVGDPEAAAERLAVLDSLQFLAVSPDADALARKLVEGHAVPATEPRDALHIALATAGGVEYLLTWNFKHIANATTRPTIERICRDNGYDPPVICTPEELSEAEHAD